MPLCQRLQRCMCHWTMNMDDGEFISFGSFWSCCFWAWLLPLVDGVAFDCNVHDKLKMSALLWTVSTACSYETTGMMWRPRECEKKSTCCEKFVTPLNWSADQRTWWRSWWYTMATRSDTWLEGSIDFKVWSRTIRCRALLAIPSWCKRTWMELNGILMLTAPFSRWIELRSTS